MPPAAPSPDPRPSAGPRPRFDLFVVLAEMRTGSNFLEANLNALPGVACHGEAFTPHFVGQPGQGEVLGVTQGRRDADPAFLIGTLKAQRGLHGFRLFGDHDPRAVEAVLVDPACAKVVLTRNPAESYVSRKIAALTGQWKLTNARHARSGQVRFEAGEFAAHLDRLQAFQLRILRALQVTGQTAFYVDYEDIQDLEVMQGLARFLGVEPPAELDRRLKKQNPEPLPEKVLNFEEMEAALGPLDRFDLSRTPNFEPRRGAMVPRMVAALGADLLHLPVPSGPEEAVRAWLAGFDPAGRVVEGFNARTLRQWKLARPGHRSFAVLRHPLPRAHAAFCERILPAAPGAYPELRETLRRSFGLPVPEGGLPEGAPWTEAEHRAAFARFLEFLKANLGGQTAVRVDPAWASQAAVVQGFSNLNPPDLILREEELAEELPRLAARLGAPARPFAAPPDPQGARLAAVADDALAALAREAYGRDHVVFGFGRWRPSA